MPRPDYPSESSNSIEGAIRAADGPDRSSGARSRSGALLALALAIAALVGPALLGRGVLGSFDLLQQFDPWRAEAPGEPELGNPLLLDQPLVMLPWLEFFSSELRAGRLPLWNPHNYLGQPIHAANTGALGWPLYWPYFAWPDPRLLAWIAAAKLLLAGLGTWAFLRSFRLDTLPSLAGALAFALCGFQIAWLGHPHTNVALLLPWSLLAVERAARRPGARTIAGAALIAGLAGVAGHLQTALHVGLFVVLWALFRSLFASAGTTRLRLRGWIDLGAGALLGVSLAAFQLLPLFDYLEDSRAAELFDQFDTASAVEPLTAASFQVAPERFGRPDVGDYSGPFGDNLNYSELVGGYVGRVALVLALIGLLRFRRDRRVLFFGIVAIAAALVAWQTPLAYDLARAVPGLRSTKLMRLLLLVAFALACLAAFGAQALLARAERGRSALGLAIVAVIGTELVAFGRGYNPTIDAGLVSPPSRTLEFLATRPQPTRVVGAEASFLAPNANVRSGISVPNGYDSIEDERMAQLVGALTSDPRAELFVKEIRWFDRVVPLASLLGIEWVASRAPLPEPLVKAHEDDSGLAIYRNPGVLPRAFLARAVEFVPTPSDALARLSGAEFDPYVALVENAPPAGFALYDRDTLAGSVELQHYGTRRIELTAALPETALLVLADTFDRGWNARVDGDPVLIERVDHALRGIWLDPGEHNIDLHYAPASVTRGLWLGGVALAIVVLLLLLSIRRSTQSAPR